MTGALNAPFEVSLFVKISTRSVSSLMRRVMIILWESSPRPLYAAKKHNFKTRIITKAIRPAAGSLGFSPWPIPLKTALPQSIPLFFIQKNIKVLN